MTDTDYRKSDKKGLGKDEICKTCQSFYGNVSFFVGCGRLYGDKNGAVLLSQQVSGERD